MVWNSYRKHARALVASLCVHSVPSSTGNASTARYSALGIGYPKDLLRNGQVLTTRRSDDVSIVHRNATYIATPRRI